MTIDYNKSAQMLDDSLLIKLERVLNDKRDLPHANPEFHNAVQIELAARLRLV